MATKWYVLRVQSNREARVRDSLDRRVKGANLEGVVRQVLVPTERVTEIKGGKRRVAERNIFPGYLMVEIEEIDPDAQQWKDAWYLIRGTPGIGDFVGPKGAPTPMAPEEAQAILSQMKQDVEQPKLRIEFQKGAHVRIKDGPFLNFEGTVEEVDPEKGRVKVIVAIFGRATPVELEYWQVEAA